ncbi:MAG: hypothetical protein AAGA15_01965 [Pseudomonadota bacterium]
MQHPNHAQMPGILRTKAHQAESGSDMDRRELTAHASILGLSTAAWFDRGDEAEETMMGRFFADCDCVFAIVHDRLAPHPFRQ